MMNGKTILRINTLFLILLICCIDLTHKIEIKNTWWYSFDLRTNEPKNCKVQLGYIELFVWEKAEKLYLTQIVEFETYSDSREFEIKSINKRGTFTLLDAKGKVYGYFKVIASNEAFLEVIVNEKVWKRKFYSIKKGLNHDYWNYFGNRKKWDEEFLCRQIIHMNEAIMEKFK